MSLLLGGEEFQFGLHRPERRETAAMDRSGTTFLDCGVMLRRGISFVLGKAVTRVKLVQLPHDVVAGDLGQDTGRGDRVTFAIALNQRCMRVRQPADSKPINQRMLGLGLQLVERHVHGPPCGLADVDLINHLDVHTGDGITNVRMRGNSGIKLFSLFLGKLLRVIQTAKF